MFKILDFRKRKPKPSKGEYHASESGQELAEGLDFANKLFNKFRLSLEIVEPGDEMEYEDAQTAINFVEQSRRLTDKQKDIFRKMIEIMVQRRNESYTFYRNALSEAQNFLDHAVPLPPDDPLKSLEDLPLNMVAGALFVYQESGHLPSQPVALEFGDMFSHLVFDSVEDSRKFISVIAPELTYAQALYSPTKSGGISIHPREEDSLYVHERAHHLVQVYTEAVDGKSKGNQDMLELLAALHEKKSVTGMNRLISGPFSNFRHEILAYLYQKGNLEDSLNSLENYDFVNEYFSQLGDEAEQYTEEIEIVKEYFERKVAETMSHLLEIHRWMAENISADYINAKDSIVKELIGILFAYPGHLWERQLRVFKQHMHELEQQMSKVA